MLFFTLIISASFREITVKILEIYHEIEFVFLATEMSECVYHVTLFVE